VTDNLQWISPRLWKTLRDREELLSASMTVATANEIKLLFLEFQSAVVGFHQTLKQPWGAKTFVVKDPDENLLRFAGPEKQPRSRGLADRALIVGKPKVGRASFARCRKTKDQVVFSPLMLVVLTATPIRQNSLQGLPKWRSEA